MKLLVLTGYWPSPGNPISGIFVQQQVAALSALNIEVQVIAPRPALRRMWNRPEFDRYQGVPIHSPTYACLPSRMLPPAAVLGFNAVSCRRSVLSVASHLAVDFRPDIVHAHGVRYAGMLIPHLRQLFGCKVVWTLHGVDPYLQRHASTYSTRGMLERAVAATDCITVVGQTLAPYAERLGMDAAALRVVPNGTEVPIQSPMTKTIRERHAGKRILLSVSNLHRDKGIHLNLQALAALNHSDTIYLIIGDGLERAALERQACALGLRERVCFLGRLPHPETMAHMAACDVFCLPSRLEAFGIVFIEAMIRGKPVIGCEDTGAAEIISAGLDGFLVRKDDPGQLTALLGSLLEDHVLRQRLGRAAKMKAARFTWAANAAAYLSLYRELLQDEDVAEFVRAERSNLKANNNDSPAYSR